MGLAQGHVWDWGWGLVLNVSLHNPCMILNLPNSWSPQLDCESVWENGNNSSAIRPGFEFFTFFTFQYFGFLKYKVFISLKIQGCQEAELECVKHLCSACHLQWYFMNSSYFCDYQINSEGRIPAYTILGSQYWSWWSEDGSPSACEPLCCARGISLLTPEADQSWSAARHWTVCGWNCPALELGKFCFAN